MSLNGRSEQDKKLLIRIPEAAEILSMCQRTVWALSVSGEIPSFKQGKQSTRLDVKLCITTSWNMH